VRLIATADVKAREAGLIEAARQLEIPLRIIASEEIKQAGVAFSRSSFVERSVGLPAVAEPAALLAGRRTRLRLPKTPYEGITVAIAAEQCIWSA
jgi:cobalt-precorrin 5A hydrolase